MKTTINTTKGKKMTINLKRPSAYYDQAHKRTFGILCDAAGIPEEKRFDYVLHHKDETLRYNDLERYYEWRIEDVVLMTRQEHRKLHMKDTVKKGSKKSEQHKKRIAAGRKMADERYEGKLVRVTRPAQEAVDVCFANCKLAADFIGCSRQLVSQCVRGMNTTACGYVIELVDMNDYDLATKNDCKKAKKAEVEQRSGLWRMGITNGDANMYIPIGLEIPEGWRKGFTRYDKDGNVLVNKKQEFLNRPDEDLTPGGLEHRRKWKGSRAITDGKTTKFLQKGKPLPKGWRYGVVTKATSKTDQIIAQIEADEQKRLNGKGK